MTKFTIEDLRDIAYRGSYDDLERELALQLLASMEQTPVYLRPFGDDGETFVACDGDDERAITLYAEPLLPQPAVVDEHIRREINVGGYLWAQCSSDAFDRAKAEGKIVRELYERPQPAVETEHSSVIAEQLAHVLSSMDVTDHQRAVINCAVDRLNKNAEILQKAPAALEAILYEPGPTDSVNAPLEFTDVEDRAWVVGAEWMRDAFKGENPHLRIANDDDPAPITASGSEQWQNWIADVAEYLEGGIEADGELEAEGSIEAKRLLARCTAMLQGAEPVSQPYTLPDGWVAVPVDPTEKMVIEGFESVPHPLFQPADWDKYQTMSGCEQAAHRAKLCWAAMVKAAPRKL
ncbi:hypothetical protein [Enterobacter hormaechei]|uniref:hypothetical protein n=1 Tax=Enterobacter hormaechei TaxID=158836 RepID=UPI003905A9C0